MSPNPAPAPSQAANLNVQFNDLSADDQTEVLEHAQELLQLRNVEVHGGEVRGRNEKGQLTVATVAHVRQDLAARQVKAAQGNPSQLTITGGTVTVAENEAKQETPQLDAPQSEHGEPISVVEAAGLVS